MKKGLLLSSGVFMTVAPRIAQAQNQDWIKSFSNGLAELFDLAVPVLIGLALVVFIWGMIVFIASSASEKGREEGKRRMVWGIVALFFIITVWGIVTLIQNITNISGTESIMAPRTQYP